MGYLGVPPQSGFITTDSQRITSSTNNYVDLDNAISSLDSVIVYVNSVKQDINNLTLTTSTRITLGGTLTSSDVVEVIYLGKAVATQTPDNGTITLDMLSASGTKSSSTFLRGDNTFATAGGDADNYFATSGLSSKDLGVGLHVKTADSGADVSVHADELVIEGSANSGLSILSGTSSNGRIMFGDSGDNDIGYIEYDHGANSLALGSNAGTRLKIDSSGKVGIGGATDLTAGDSDNSIFQVGGSTHNTYAAHIFHSANPDSAAPYGMQITYTGGAPDQDSNTANLFIRCNDTTTERFKVAGDGDVLNHDNSYGSISDERLKTNIVDANSQWDDVKALKIRKYERKDDIELHGAGEKVQLGVIAQELETAGMTGLTKDGEPSDFDIKHGVPADSKVKSVKYSVLYMKAIKALQEAMTRIETLETEMTALKARVTTLEG